MNRKRAGFTLVEILVVIAIIGILASIILASLAAARGKARDVKRKAELSQIGRFIAGGGCYAPNGGDGEYDLADLIGELKIKYPQSAQLLSRIPKDPSAGTDTKSFYKYVFSSVNGSKCALYANLESAGEQITLPNLTAPTAGGGTGVLKAASDGWNGTPIYLQYSN